MENFEARHALDQLSTAQARMVDDLGRSPPWRHMLFGALFGVLIGSIAISRATQFYTAPLLLVAIALIIRSDRRRLGVFINGYRRGATLPLTGIFLVAMIVCVFAGMKLRVDSYELPYKLVLAALAFALATGFSIYWQSIYRLELKAGVGGAKA